MFITTADELHRLGYLDGPSYSSAREVEQTYPIKIPQSYLEIGERGNPECPILKQSIPAKEEIADCGDGMIDPIGDGIHQKMPGLIHRYPNRLLIIVTRTCFLYCRFCFRKNSRAQGEVACLTDTHRYLILHPEINEVILSGGDPLVLTNAQLFQWISALNKIASLRRIRIHTRALVAFPQRFDEAFFHMMNSTDMRIVFSIHINHPKEITVRFRRIASRLKKSGVLLVSQTVLLKGVNDSPEILASLFDMFQYIIGTNFGKLKYILISPEKTVEGYIGGYMLSMILSLILEKNLCNMTIVYIMGICGDLFASWIKRMCCIKDFSNALGNHGGFIDRLDSALFIIPLLNFINI